MDAGCCGVGYGSLNRSGVLRSKLLESKRVFWSVIATIITFKAVLLSRLQFSIKLCLKV